MEKKKNTIDTIEEAKKTIRELILPSEKKKVITLFMIIIFSLLLVMSAYIPNWFLRIWFQVILFVAQLVIVNAILTDYYS